MTQNRLIISFNRVTGRDAAGKVKSHVHETINLVHPEDNRGHDGQRSGLNGFREIGMMLRGNPDYFDVNYQKLEAVA